MTADSSKTVRFHLGPFERFVLPTVAVVAFGLIGFSEARSESVVIGFLFWAVALVIVWIAGSRISLEVGPTDVTIRNVFRKYVVPLAEIDAIEQAYEGAYLVRRGGHRVLILAIQRWNISLLHSSETRADRIVEFVLDRRP